MERVADARVGHWTERLPASVAPYAQLARWDRPIGWWLLLWPCWWSVGLALNAKAPLFRETAPLRDGATGVEREVLDALAGPGPLEAGWICLLFLVGAVAMRGAGCTWNDVTDRKLDAAVARTRSRPLPSGRVGVRAALAFIVAQLAVGLLVLLALAWTAGSVTSALGLMTAANVIALGFLSVPIVVLYPFAKRVTDWPQVVLGLAFSWGALMGWAVVFGGLGIAPLLLYAGAVAWTVGYDTIYAHQDREDDALVGVRSTARLFGERTVPALVAMYALALALFAAAFWTVGAHPVAYAGLLAAGWHMARQVRRLDIHDADQCLALFRSNATLGWLVFGGLVAGWLARLLG